MHKPHNTLLLWFLFAAGAVSCYAQTGAPGSPGPQAPTVLRSTTRLVQINVIVHNKKGEPVDDLKKEDFTIQDQVQAQQVATFSAVAAAPREPSSAPRLPSNVFTNRAYQTSGTPGSVTVILFDALNTPVADQFYAR